MTIETGAIAEDMEVKYSVCPNGEAFVLPSKADFENEYERLKSMVGQQRSTGREIVVVMGVGFVGSVMAGVIADSVDRGSGEPAKFVIGMQRPSPRSFWKIHYLNRGQAPVEAEDPEVAPLIRRCVLEKRTLVATYTYDALSLADVVVVDVQCDYHKEKLGDVRKGRADIAALEESLKIIGEKIKPDCMVLIETTVPPGTTEYVAYPTVKKAFEKRGIGANPPVGPLLREGHARKKLRVVHSGFLEGLQRRERGVATAGRTFPFPNTQCGPISPHRS